MYPKPLCDNVLTFLQCIIQTTEFKTLPNEYQHFIPIKWIYIYNILDRTLRLDQNALNKHVNGALVQNPLWFEPL